MTRPRKSLLDALLFAGAVLMAFAPGAAKAVVMFQIIETAGPGGTGQYTLINNSGNFGYAAEYIYGFSVTNPLASSVNDWTTEKGWVAAKAPLFGGPKTSFAYATLPGVFTFSHWHLGFWVNPETIGPGESSSNFFFGTDLLASSATLLLVDANGRFSTFTTDAVAAVPEPSTWAMLILGFAAIGVMTYRRRRSTSPIAAT
jgi:hypothetical protein